MINKGGEDAARTWTPPDPDRALWKQIYEELAGRIVTGVYRPRTAIPSLTQLEEEFGVARNTARKVVSKLAADGFVRSEMGVATFVRPAKDWQPPEDTD